MTKKRTLKEKRRDQIAKLKRALLPAEVRKVYGYDNEGNHVVVKR